MPYKRIAAELGVSPSSAFAWTSDIELTAEQRAYNLTGPLGPVSPELVRRRSLAWAEKCRERRRQAQEGGAGPRARSRSPAHGWLHAVLGRGDEGAKCSLPREL